MARMLPILTFHDLDESGSVISVAPAVFARGMAALRANGYRSLSLEDLPEALRRRGGFPERSLCVTFDDGYESVYTHAFPVLERCGMSATVFLTACTAADGKRLASFNGRPMLAWSEIAEMHRHGFSFGAHTLTHPDLTALAEEDVERELRESRDVIAARLGASVRSFAYPFGRSDRRVREVARRLFCTACSDRLGFVAAGCDPIALPRVDAYYLRTDRLFRLVASRLFPYYVGTRALPRLLRRAVQRTVR